MLLGHADGAVGDDLGHLGSKDVVGDIEKPFNEGLQGFFSFLTVYVHFLSVFLHVSEDASLLGDFVFLAFIHDDIIFSDAGPSRPCPCLLHNSLLDSVQPHVLYRGSKGSHSRKIFHLKIWSGLDWRVELRPLYSQLFLFLLVF